MSKVKGIDTEDEQMRFFPVMDGLMEVNATTKRKQGYIKLALPDDMINYLMSLSLGQEIDAEQFLVSFRLKDK